MSQNDRIAKLADDATAGLRDDPELRLSARAELIAHIEDKIAALKSEGKSDEESLNLGLKSFGAATDVAGEMLTANRPRMKLRALARLAVRGLLVPAAIVLATIVFVDNVSRAFYIQANFVNLQGVEREWARGNFFHSYIQRKFATPVDKLSSEKAFLFHGDKSRPTRTEQQRAIWERHTENKIYYGQYISHLAAGIGTDVSKSQFIAEELRRGETLDPENARYTYLLATLELKQAIEWRAKDNPNDKPKLVVKDRGHLDRATAEFLRAQAKPSYHRYGREMLAERINLLPEPQCIEEQLFNMSTAAGVLLPDLSHHREMARVIPRYAEMLIAEGKITEAEAILKAWYPFVLHLQEDPWTLIDLLVLNAILQIVQNDYPPVYEKLGKPEMAKATRQLAALLSYPIERWRASTRAKYQGEDLRLVRSGGIMAQLLMPVLGAESLRDVDFSYGRELDHLLVEQIGTLIIMGIFFLLMLCAWVVAFRWRWARGMDSAPLLLLPNWKNALRILGLGVLLPLGLYFIYTRYSGFAGRELSFRTLTGRMALEMLLMIMTMSVLVIFLSSNYIRARCQCLQIPIPKRWKFGLTTLGLVVIGVGWVLCLSLKTDYMDPQIAVFLVLGTGFLLSLFTVFSRFLVGSRAYGVYYGTTARSMIPFFAVAVILVGPVTQPYFTRRETFLVRNDPIFRVEAGGFTKVETDLVNRLKTEMTRMRTEVEGFISGNASPPSNGVKAIALPTLASVDLTPLMKKYKVKATATVVGRDADKILEAIRKSDTEKTQSLLRENPSLANAAQDRHNLWFMLHEAAAEGRIEIVKLLLQHNANPDAANATGETPLHWAARKGHTEIVKLLIEHNADTDPKDQKDRTPLHEAAFRGQKEIVELLIAAKADVSAKDKAGKTPLFYTLDNDHKEVAELLHKAGAKEQ